MKILIGLLYNWFFWWVWLNTIGRLSGGLSWPSWVVFDLLSVGFWLAWYQTDRFQQITSALTHSTLLEYKKSPLRFGIWTLPAILSVGFAFFYNRTMFEGDWDGLAYHLPIALQAVQFQQWGRLDDPMYAVQSYPAMTESLYVYWILHFGHTLHLLLAMSPLLIGAVAILDLSRSLDLSRRWGILLWLTIPVVIKQTTTLYIDHFIGAFGVVALAGLVRKRELIFAIGLAFLAGSKYSSAFPALLLLMSWVIRYRKIPWKSLALVGVSTLATFIPNLINFGNPLAPFPIQIFGISIFPGSSEGGEFLNRTVTVSMPWYTRLSELIIPRGIASYDMLFGAFGTLQGVLFFSSLAAAAWSFYKSITLKDKKPVLILPEGLIGILISPIGYILRYHLWVVGPMILSGVGWLQRQSRPLKQIVWTLLLVQSIYLIPDFTWFNQDYVFSEIAKGQYSNAIASLQSTLRIFFDSKGERPMFSTPDTNEVIAARSRTNQVYVFCPKDRPLLLGAYYSRDFSSKVYFNQGVCK